MDQAGVLCALREEEFVDDCLLPVGLLALEFSSLLDKH